MRGVKHFQSSGRAEIRFQGKTILTSLPRNIYSDRRQNNIIIKFDLCVIHVL